MSKRFRINVNSHGDLIVAIEVIHLINGRKVRRPLRRLRHFRQRLQANRLQHIFVWLYFELGCQFFPNHYLDAVLVVAHVVVTVLEANVRVQLMEAIELVAAVAATLAAHSLDRRQEWSSARHLL